MKLIFVLVILGISTSTTGKLQCDVRVRQVKLISEWLDMDSICIRAMRQQIQEEINASMKYLAMGTHFAQDMVSRPGFAEFFFKTATHKREHAIRLIEYLLMRTQVTPVGDLIKVNAPEIKYWKQGAIALEDALRIEAEITRNIKYVIETCDDGDRKHDYHLVDYLTSEFLGQQYHDQRNLAEKISTLKKMMRSATNDVIGEYLFDKQLLS